jgi:hypothetical protein
MKSFIYLVATSEPTLSLGKQTLRTRHSFTTEDTCSVQKVLTLRLHLVTRSPP